MQALVLLLFAPFIILNMLGGVVGGVWLVILGEWRLLAFGILYMICGALMVGLLLLPGMLFAAPAAMAAERRKFILTAFLGVPAIGWTFAVMTVSCVLVFSTVVSHIEGSLIPYVLWAYAAAMAPWSYMASVKSRSGNDTASIPLFCCQLGTISMIVAVFRNPYESDFWRLFWWFLPFAALGIAIQLLIVVAGALDSRRIY